jgi:hypothetical protein
LSAAEELRRTPAFGTSPRLSVTVFRRRVLTGPPALERRLIAPPRLRTTLIFKVGLQQGFVPGGMGLNINLRCKKS